MSFHRAEADAELKRNLFIAQAARDALLSFGKIVNADAYDPLGLGSHTRLANSACVRCTRARMEAITAESSSGSNGIVR